jgi:transcriptional pleiotropic regulator of transition state genes
MKSTGIVRRIDSLGRVTLPSELRKQFDLIERDCIEIFVDTDQIILQKYQPADIFTGVMDELIDYHGKKVSKKSIIEMASLAGLNIHT